VSFILDALRKSEHERQRTALPGLAQVPLATPPAQLPRWASVVIGVLAAAVLVLGGAWWQSTRAPAEIATSAPIVERRVELPPAPIAVSPAPSAALADRATLRSPPPEPTAPLRENALAAAVGPTSTESAAAQPSFSPPPVALPADEPALPSAAALAAQGIVLPELRLELHAFREQPRDRFVFINGRKYVEGERLVEGPQVVSIVPTGAVLIHTGRRFLLVAE
jgi:general secretion pathway protein B